MPRKTAFYRPESLCADESVGYLMRRVLQSIAQHTDAGLAPQELTYAQWLPLYKLRTLGEVTVAALARELSVDPGAATRMLDRLEKKGLCVRRRSTEDRRVVHVALTEAGQAVAAQVPQVLAGVLNAHLAGFSREEWTTLQSMLRRMLDNGEALHAAAREQETR